MTESPYLFVYGTLRGAANTEWSRFLTAESRLVDSGHTHGVLYDLNGYPGMTLGVEDSAWVYGEVYLLNDPSRSLSRLDIYEGCSPDDPLPHEFERQIVTVLFEGGQAIKAWTYVYSRDTSDKERIASGDYLQPKSC